MKSRLFNAIKQSSKEEFSLLSKAQIFNIDNVAEYYWQSPQENWHIEKDFPILTLPFDTCYFEYRMPEGQNDVLQNCGILAQKGLRVSSGTSIDFLVYFTTQKAYFYAGAVTLIIDDKGMSVPIPGHEPLSMAFYMPEEYVNENTREQMQDNLSTALHPCWLAISFLHCKNVTIEQRGAGLNFGRRKRHEPNIRYHVLVIEPMKKILKTEGRSDEVGIKRALYICRGHFKDFRETGLFGKFRDIYWWNPQVRGKVENGIVLKDYNVDAPNEPEEK